MSEAKHGIRSKITEKLFINLLCTTMLTNFAGSAVAVIDGMLTSRFLGTANMAANGIAASYFFMISILSWWLVTGCQNLCIAALGKGDKKEASRLFDMVFWFALIVSTLIGIYGTFFTESVSVLFGAGKRVPGLQRATVSYLRGLFPGAPFFTLSIILVPFLQLDGDARRVRLATAAVVITDIAGDLLNVLVFHGGMFGMGLATSISQLVQFLILFSHFLRKDRMIQIHLVGINRKDFLAVLKEGSPKAINFTGMLLAPLVLNRVALGLGGSDAVAVLTVVRNSGTLFLIYGEAVFSSTLVLAKLAVGEINKTMFRDVGKMGLFHSVFGTSILALVVVLLAPQISGLYIPESGAVRQMAVLAIRVFVMQLPLQALVSQMEAFLQALGDISGANLLHICDTFVLAVLPCAALGQMMGINGLWLGYPIGRFLMCVLVLIYARIKNHSLQEKLRELNVSESDVLEASLQTSMDVVVFSENLRHFCQAHGYDNRLSLRFALCMEELSQNVLFHGFRDATHNHLEVRALARQTEVILRLRDDCRPFDFKSLMDEWQFDERHPEKNIGIRIVRSLAREVVYTGTLKTNNLLIIC